MDLKVDGLTDEVELEDRVESRGMVEIRVGEDFREGLS